MNIKKWRIKSWHTLGTAASSDSETNFVNCKTYEHLDQPVTCTVRTEESKRVNNIYPNRIQTRGPGVEAVQEDRRLKQMNGAQVSQCWPQHLWQCCWQIGWVLPRADELFSSSSRNSGKSRSWYSTRIAVSCRVSQAFYFIAALSNDHTHCCGLQKLAKNCNLKVL